MNNPKNASKKIDKFVEHYVIENFENIMGDRFGRYSKYIIQDRALQVLLDSIVLPNLHNGDALYFVQLRIAKVDRETR